MGLPRAYYNEIDPLKAEILRETIKAGAIAPGDVDERSIADIRATELVPAAQVFIEAYIEASNE